MSRNSLLFDFTVDKALNKIYVKREFASERSLVWDAFTKKEILDQWWAPLPWLSKTKYMDFKVGGRRFYAMVGPGGEEHWGVQDFTSITAPENFQYMDSFADKNEVLNADIPPAQWNLDFTESNSKTTVSIDIQYKSLSDLEQNIEMGFKEGFTMALDHLAKLLNK